ncbi:hypothetical protein EAO73_10890 [Streptomyces sp. col6]|nr:hypothetical protein EAO73_10890 [Streptomyces sp. col6]
MPARGPVHLFLSGGSCGAASMASHLLCPSDDQDVVFDATMLTRTGEAFARGLYAMVFRRQVRRMQLAG